MRLFYAIEFPDPVKASIAALSRELAAMATRGRWSRPENIHLTLQFLGECPEAWRPDLGGILRETAASSWPFNLTIQGCGTFGESNDIFWLGVAPEPALDQLASRLKTFLRLKNLPSEKKPFSAHITLAREVRIPPDTLAGWNYPPLDCPVNQISLMESVRVEGILVYRPLERAQLNFNMR